MRNNIRSTNLRFNLEKDLQRKAWEYLQTMDKQEFKSYSHVIALALVDYFDRYYRTQGTGRTICKPDRGGSGKEPGTGTSPLPLRADSRTDTKGAPKQGILSGTGRIWTGSRYRLGFSRRITEGKEVST